MVGVSCEADLAILEQYLFVFVSNIGMETEVDLQTPAAPATSNKRLPFLAEV
jgi:hypothetical protein